MKISELENTLKYLKQLSLGRDADVFISVQGLLYEPSLTAFNYLVGETPDTTISLIFAHPAKDQPNHFNDKTGFNMCQVCGYPVATFYTEYCNVCEKNMSKGGQIWDDSMAR